jgi:hypothetical protein
MVIITSCGNGNSPRDVAEKAVQCLIDKDYEGYVNLTYMDAKDPKEQEREKAMLVAMVGEKYEKMLKEKGGIKSYTFISEEIKEDKAIVKMTFEYGNGDKKDDRIKLVNKDGKWWLSNSK